MSDKQVGTLPNRDQLPEDKTWDLTVLFASDEAWEEALKAIDPLLDAFLAFQDKLGEGAATLADAFSKLDELDRLLEKVYVYSHLKSDENTANSTYQGMQDRISAKLAGIQGRIAWFEPEILALPQPVFDGYLQADELAFYRRSLTELARSRPHTLSQSEERILGMSSDVFHGPSKTFSMLNNADIKFPMVTDDQGNEIELTHGNYIKFLESNDRKVRKQAFEGMYDTFHGFRNTLAATLDTNVKVHVLNAKLRNYDCALGAALHPDNVSPDIYNNLIETVRKSLPCLHNYMDLRRKVLNLDALDMFDIYNPLVPDSKMSVDWQQAVDWVRASLQPMGEQYCATLEKAFTDRWIDSLECRGKRAGAYSSGCYDSPPYVLMNFNGTLNSVFTLAHELGHSMHSHYSKTCQDYHYADYRIFVAEVASTTNELLLHHYLLNTLTDERAKLYLLNHLIDEVRGTVFRQTMFAEFERFIHEQNENGVPLTADFLSEHYFKLNADYHGDAVKPDQRIEMEWARIPHFYYNFYVYKYATGLSAAVTLSRKILSGNAADLDAYLGFLKAGSSQDVLDIMRDAGVDLSVPDPIEQALATFDETVKGLGKGLLGG